MKANKVLKILNISRATLCTYLKHGKISGKLGINNHYEYDEESVFKLLNKELVRKNVVYARVSTSKQKKDLENQCDSVCQFCIQNGIKIDDIYKDIGSGLNLDRKEFQRLLSDVVEYRISKIYITYKDRLSRISFNLFKDLFEKFHCQIIVINEIDDAKIIEKEIFEEIIGLLHCFSMKMYSSRRKQKLKLIEKEMQLENDAIS